MVNLLLQQLDFIGGEIEQAICKSGLDLMVMLANGVHPAAGITFEKSAESRDQEKDRGVWRAGRVASNVLLDPAYKLPELLL